MHLLKKEMRANTFDAATNTVRVSPERARSDAEVQKHYVDLFGSEQGLATLRGQYAMPENALPRVEDRQALSAFFFWSSWSARPIGRTRRAFRTPATGRTSRWWATL